MELSLDTGEEAVAQTFAPKARFYTVEQLGERQSITPDGFLLCQDTPIARIGSQVYGEQELPGMRGKDGIITIQRDAAEVFRPETIASFNGKPVTNNHPPEKVTPSNFKLFSVGTVLNPRRGDGIQFDNNFLYADLLITDPQAIADVRSGKREVSAGYDAEYKQTGDGQGIQHDIVGNHVALVNRGRCGPLCAIGDEQMPTRVRVNDSRRKNFRDRLLGAFHSRDESAFHDQLEELSKIPELLGEQVSGEESGEGRTGDTHVSINLGPGGGGGGPTISSGGAPVGDQPDDPAPASEAAGGAMQQILQRLDRIEQAIVVLAQGESEEQQVGEGEEYDRAIGDRRTAAADRRVRDQETPTAPPSEDPYQDPPQTLPYGAGTTGTTETRHEPPQLGTGDKGTRDRRLTGDGKAFVGDSTSMQMEFQEAISRAELLVPNVRVPTFDARTPAKVTFDTLCSLRRNVLQEAYRDSEKHAYIDVLLAGKPPQFTNMTCDAVLTVFNGASELARQANNSSFGRVRPTGVRGAGRPLTPADINARNREKWSIH